ncbi:MAG: hypothetical protein Q8K85_21150, partial [Hyphomicrobium sp.]|nr:hypothetical protein [Hyphomicrobium sp.]
MIRIVAENIALFLLPTIVYIAFIYLTREDKPGATSVLDDAPLIWLFVAGAVLVAEETKPDVFVMDLGLPDGSGIDATAAVVGISRDLTRDALLPDGDLEGLAERAERVIRSVDLQRQLIRSE